MDKCRKAYCGDGWGLTGTAEKLPVAVFVFSGIISVSMVAEQTQYRLFFSAAEPSADAHCAGLIKALRQKDSRIECYGVGGEKMAQAGCKLIEITGAKASMAYKAFSQVGRYIELINKIKFFLKSQQIDLVIVCDSPAFNFHVAKAAKKASINVVFYVAPQLWAWGGWRIRKMRKYCDKLCCILPFEEDWFSNRGIDTTFVGNPLLDEVDIDLEQNKKDYTNFDCSKARIAIMPGSRPAEIAGLWQPMQGIALTLKEKFPLMSFAVVAVNEGKKKILVESQLPGFECEYLIGNCFEAARGADFSIVASGSATLQVAAAGCPMVIMYQSSRILWHLAGRWLVRTKYLSLVNILAQKKLVPEFMPYFTSTEPISTAVEQLLGDKEKMAAISRELVELAKPLKSNASEKTADIIIDFLQCII
jgi:lipid-A-disaccharide synthase